MNARGTIQKGFISVDREMNHATKFGPNGSAVASRRYIWPAFFLMQCLTWSKSVTMRKFVGLSPHGNGTAIYVNILADSLHYSSGEVLA